jgi:type IV fimbrial biogenesis protein FimT
MVTKHQQRGMNLIELMAVLAVAAIVLSAGIPALQNTVERYNLRSETTRLITSLNYARSQAVTRQQMVTLSRTSTTTKDWSEGWIIYSNAETQRNQPFNSSKDQLLKDMSVYKSASSILANNDGNNWIHFDANGRLDETNPVKIAICETDLSGNLEGRLITINLVGRTRVTTIAADSAKAANCAP